MKNKLATRTITALILSGMLLSTVLTSCAEKADDDAASTTAADASVTEPLETDRSNYKDTLPDDLDFGGMDFTILARGDESFLKEFLVEEDSGEVVDSAVFTRNSKVAERLNINYNVFKGYGSHEYGNELARIRQNIVAGDDAWQAIAGYSVQLVKIMTENLFLNLNEVEYLDFTMPWWPKSVINEMNFNGNLFFATGDIAFSTTSKAVCMYFNKTLQENYNIEDLYDIVNSGEWTMDKLNEICSGLYTDDGDSRRNEKDSYGLTMTSYNSVDGFMGAFHQNVTTLNEDGYPELTMNNERMVNIVEAIYSLMNDNPGVYVPRIRIDDLQTMTEVFTNDRSLFMMWEFTAAETGLREMESKFGIIPYPKLNDLQESYGCYMQDGHTLITIPNTIYGDMLSMTGAVLEALAAESYRTVTPAYFEVALQGKYTRDNESVQMLELIRDSIKYNFGYVYMVNAFYTLRNLANQGTNGSKDFASYWRKQERAFTKELEKMIDKYEENIG